MQTRVCTVHAEIFAFVKDHVAYVRTRIRAQTHTYARMRARTRTRTDTRTYTRRHTRKYWRARLLTVVDTHDKNLIES